MSNTPKPRNVARTIEWAQVDVFAENLLEGNMLAIFPDARGLTSHEMQALARETNLSETTFIVPRDAAIERERGVQVRIFTVQEELPFAGHPTLGTASWLWWNHPSLRGAEEIRLDLQVGQIPVRFQSPEQGGIGVFGEMHQRDPEFGPTHDKAAVAEALGLTTDDLHAELPIQTVSTGMDFCIVPLRSLDVAARLQIPQDRAVNYLAAHQSKFFYCITPAANGSGADWHARMQFYNGEDPATGSAAGCAIAYLVRHGAVASQQQIVIEQGIEMLRPSKIHARARALSANVDEIFIGGRTIPVAMGRFFLP
ncbi:MAG: PhzF family phenazine biosynthesis protein [Acidobacteriaceae bacterium]